jgi:Flp pilus assembly protein TadD/2-polyprenyl-3-methyl-5-hydroxy-6-metoxy-1,4-benzoquinol methylase
MSASDPFHQQLARASAELQARRPAAAEALYREVLAASPDHGAATHFLGMSLVQQGRTAEGLATMRRSLDLPGSGARWRHNYALMLAQSGELAAAESELAAAAAMEPQNAVIFQYLGMVRQQRGRPREAADAYRAACALAPDNPQLANNLGTALADAGDTPGAVQAYRRAASLQPRYAPAWHNLAMALAAQGEDDAAFDALRRAVEADAHFAPAWQQFADRFAAARFTAWDAAAAADLAAALVQPAIDPQPMAEAAASLVLLDPALESAAAAFERGAGTAWLEPARIGTLASPLLVALLPNALITDARLEALLVRVRAALLFAWRDGTLASSRGAADLLLSLAQQCFLNEYVWEETPPESAVLGALEAEVLARGAPHLIALYASYRPLGALRGLQPAAAAGEGFAALWRTQVETPAAERELADGIAALTPITDAVSQAVRAQYERNPYPRWQRLPATRATVFPVRQALAVLFPHVDQERLALPDAPDMLVAGCGTGFQTAVAAARNPRARILAVDLSLASLAYAKRRAQELGLVNVSFAQADLLALGALTQRFHVIECAGVLHHLADPLAGWRVLRGLLQPGGVMKIALYSELARTGVVEARAIAARAGLQGDLAGVRELRRRVRALPDTSPARSLALSTDFASASGARDLMLHVQEQRFTTGRIAAALEALDLAFLGFEIPQPAVRAAYRARFPDDAHAASLDHWGRFEAEHPETFTGMYQFWVAAAR